MGRPAPRSVDSMGTHLRFWSNRRGRRLPRRCLPLLALLLAAVMVPLLGSSAKALIVVGNADYTSPPADDPGWASVSSAGSNSVYLGDSWVLTAVHVGLGSTTFSSGTYSAISGQDFIITNPEGSGLSTNSDLRLIRINGDPGLAAPTLASAPPSAGDVVTVVTEGSDRAADQSHWYVNRGASPWTWSVVSSGGNYHGYRPTSPVQKRWGTNAIASASSVFPTANIMSGSSIRGVVDVNGRDTVSVGTLFDQYGGLADESQVTAGDSGGAMFRKTGDGWELAGIVDAQLVFSGQPDTDGNSSTGSGCGAQGTFCAVFGNGTSFVDISYYHDQIQAVLDAHPDYSLIGDLNLDGEIWDGTGDPTADPDIAAFLAGWMSYDDGEGSIASWQRGDMNRDGTTDVDDFLLMRGALNPAGAGSLAALLSVGGFSPVPEPASGVLLVVGGALAVLRWRRRRCTAG